MALLLINVETGLVIYVHVFCLLYLVYLCVSVVYNRVNELQDMGWPLFLHCLASLAIVVFYRTLHPHLTKNLPPPAARKDDVSRKFSTALV